VRVTAAIASIRESNVAGTIAKMRWRPLE